MDPCAVAARKVTRLPSNSQRSIWSRVYGLSTWALIGYFGLMAVVHVFLTALFYLGVWDTGVGYFLDYDWPAWLIAVLDGGAALLLFNGYRRGGDRPWLGLLLTVAASLIMLGRALWFVIIPLLVVLTIAGSIGRVTQTRRTSTRT